MRQFVVSTLRSDVEQSVGGDLAAGARFGARVKAMAACLKKEEIGDGLRAALESAAEILHEDIPEEAEELFLANLEAVAALPQERLEGLVAMGEPKAVRRSFSFFS